MRYCEYCGAPLDDDALFCATCGQRLSTIGPSLRNNTPKVADDPTTGQFTDSPQTKMSVAAKTQAADNSNRRRTWFFIIGGVLLAALIAGGIIFFLNRQNSDVTDEPIEYNEEEESWNGDYYFNGNIDGKWDFDMQLHIQGESVNGRYQVHGSGYGYVTIRGYITPDGKIRIDEYNPNGTATGYYIQGVFSKTGITGKYLSTRGTIDMSFYAKCFDDERSTYEGSAFENQHPSYDSPQIIHGGEGDEYFGTTTVDVFRWEGE